MLQHLPQLEDIRINIHRPGSGSTDPCLTFEPRALAVQRDVLPELVEHDRRQQLRADEAARASHGTVREPD